MKRLTGTLALIILTFVSAAASNEPSEEISNTKKTASHFSIMQADAQMVMSEFARSQARNTRYTFNMLTSRISFDYKIALYTDLKSQESQSLKSETTKDGRND